MHFVAEDEIPCSNTTDGLAQKEVAITTNTALLAPPAEPLKITPNRLRTISSLRDRLGQLEADFTQFQIISSGDVQQMKDKMVQQDNLLKLQKQAIDEISSDLSLQVKLLQDMLSQQSTQIKKLQEENQSLQKKHTKTVQSNLALKEQHDGLLTEVNFLKEQVRALWEKPLDTPDNTETTTKDPHAILEASEPTEENPLPKPPTEDNIVLNGQAPLQKDHSGNNDPPPPPPPPPPDSCLQSLLNQTQQSFSMIRTENFLTRGNYLSHSKNTNTLDVLRSSMQEMLYKMHFKNTLN